MDLALKGLKGIGRWPLTRPLQTVIESVASKPQVFPVVKIMQQRVREFDTAEPELTAVLAGIAMDPVGRRTFDTCLDSEVFSAGLPPFADEVVVGAGLHAAIYCAMRVRNGCAKPLVLDQNLRAGGAFACSRGPAFYLNSRNRAGDLGLPGEEGSLNYLPGAVIQPAHTPGGEYHTNDMLAWVIRVNLAMFARVRTCCKVQDVEVGTGKNYGIDVLVEDSLEGEVRVRTRRVVILTGLGTPRRVIEHPRCLTFDEFMARMDRPFPLRDMGRVAVVGTGNSAMNVIEALCGQGPQPTMVALDKPRVIDWYGVQPDNWEERNRPRYRDIGGLLRPTPNGGRPAMVRALPRCEDDVLKGYDFLYVGPRRYDYVIDCRGFRNAGMGVTRLSLESMYFDEALRVGTRAFAYDADGRKAKLPIFIAGPASGLNVDATDSPAVNRLPENRTALFRYADRTAALALSS